MDNHELDNKIVIYQTEDGRTQLDVKLENETVWLTQAQLVQFLIPAKPMSVSISGIFMKMANWTQTQLFGNSELFKLRARGRLVVM